MGGNIELKVGPALSLSRVHRGGDMKLNAGDSWGVGQVGGNVEISAGTGVNEWVRVVKHELFSIYFYAFVLIVLYYWLISHVV